MTPARQHAILGISADYHDAAAAVVIDGVLVNAAQQERFSRVKNDPSVPIDAMRWCLDDAEIGLSDLTHVIVSGKPLSAFERFLSSHASAGLQSLPSLARTLGTWSKSRLWVGYRIESALRSLGVESPDIWYAEHHLSHAAAAFYPSPFESAAIVTLDGVGEWATTSIAVGIGDRIAKVAEQRFPDSIGLLCAATAAFCGFAADGGEQQLMDLAPYGVPRFVDQINGRLFERNDNGAFKLNQHYFHYRAGKLWFRTNRWNELFEGAPVPLGVAPTQRVADIASSIQAVVEDAAVEIAKHAYELTGKRSLCLSGSVALNRLANSKIQASSGFEHLWIPPAPGDSGTAVGAALLAAHQLLGTPRDASVGDRMRGALLGPRFSTTDVAQWLHRLEVPFQPLDEAELFVAVASQIADGAVVGLFDGPMEFGAQALGCRSILADPRAAGSIPRISQPVTPEAFRPLPAAVLAESVNDWFESLDGSDCGNMPYMTIAVRTKGWIPPSSIDGKPFAEQLRAVESPLPAITHVDGTACVQTVGPTANPRFRKILEAFWQLTGLPVLATGSFCRVGDPIVCSPRDAILTAFDIGLDLLVIEGNLVEPEALMQFAEWVQTDRRGGLPNQRAVRALARAASSATTATA